MTDTSPPRTRRRRTFKARRRGQGAPGTAAWLHRYFPPFILFVLLTLNLTRTAGVIVLIASTFFYASKNRKAITTSPLLTVWLLSIPCLAILSTFWSAVPLLTLRNSAELFFTAALGIILARSQSRINIVDACYRALSADLFINLVDIILSHQSSPLQGIYESKNELATVSMLSILASLATLLGAKRTLGQKAAAFAFIVLGASLFVGARSTGAALSLGLGVMVLFACYMMKRFPNTWRVAAMATAVASIMAMLVVIFPNAGDLRTQVPIILGKNPNITGRTFLWDAAKATISSSPLVGHGYRAYWQSDSLGANAVKAAIGLPVDSAFNFHNEYLEAGVDLGILGISLLVLYLLVLFITQSMLTLRSRSITQGFFLAITTAFLLRTPVETSLLNQFTFFTVVFFALLTMGVARWRISRSRRRSSRSRNSRRQRQRSGSRTAAETVQTRRRSSRSGKSPAAHGEIVDGSIEAHTGSRSVIRKKVRRSRSGSHGEGPSSERDAPSRSRSRRRRTKRSSTSQEEALTSGDNAAARAYSSSSTRRRRRSGGGPGGAPEGSVDALETLMPEPSLGLVDPLE